ncbi:uncharacterized protein V6R79_011272 [Siganus canaliculatus]
MPFVGKWQQQNGHMVELDRAYVPSIHARVYLHKHDRPRATSPGNESAASYISQTTPQWSQRVLHQQPLERNAAEHKADWDLHYI